MNKAFLVALREFKENIQTKTFWIGILAFPVILTLAIMVPMWLEKTKDIRQYAVIDQSGWLLEAVEEKAASPDLEKVFRATVDKYRKGGEDFDALPDVLKQMAPVLENLEDEQLKLFASAIAAFSGPEGTAGPVDMELPEAGRDAILQFHGAIQSWWQSLPPKEAAKYGSGLAKSRYARVEVDPSTRDLQAELNARIAGGDLFAYFVIGKDPLTDSEGNKYVSNNLTDRDLKEWFSRHATEVVRSRRIDQAGIDPDIAKKIREWLNFEEKKISKTGEEEEVAAVDKVRQWAPVGFVYLLWISVFTITQMLLTNTVEEKSNKIIEVLLSSVSPIQLMAGKICGIALTGLTMVISWIVFFFAGIKLFPYFLDEMPKTDFSVIARDPIYIASFLAYFIMGYLLLAAILVGIGSVCNSLKEAQNLMTPVTIILIIPLVSMVPIGKDPNGTLAKVMSFIPPFTPFVMMNRAAGPPSVLEYLLTTILLILSIGVAFWAAAKIFRIGILMTGKPPRLLEILKWVRAPVGHILPRQKE